MYYAIVLYSWLITWSYIKYGEVVFGGITIEEAAKVLESLSKASKARISTKEFINRFNDLIEK